MTTDPTRAKTNMKDVYRLGEKRITMVSVVDLFVTWLREKLAQTALNH